MFSGFSSQHSLFCIFIFNIQHHVHYTVCSDLLNVACLPGQCSTCSSYMIITHSEKWRMLHQESHLVKKTNNSSLSLFMLPKLLACCIECGGTSVISSSGGLDSLWAFVTANETRMSQWTAPANHDRIKHKLQVDPKKNPKTFWICCKMHLTQMCSCLCIDNKYLSVGRLS